MNKPLQAILLAITLTFFGGGSNITFAGAAFSLSNIIKQAEIIKVNAVTAATNSAITVSTTIRGFAANDPYQIKSIDIPKTTYMTRFKAGMGESGGLKGLLKRNAWYAAWAGTMFAAGWALDELTNQVTQTKTIYKGQCGSPRGNAYGVTMDECFAYAVFYDIVKSYSVTAGPNPPVIGQTTTYKVTYCAASRPDYCYNPMTVQFTPQSQNQSAPAPVPDDALYDSLIAKMLQDKESAAQAFMVPDAWPYPYPQVLPDTVPYIPGVSQADQELLDLYARGLLQSTNPNAPYYVSPERYAQIVALANQLQQASTPESQADAANQQLKNPLTQKQLEESLKKEREAQDKATKDALGEKPNLDTLLDPYKAFEQDVKSTPSNQVNQLPSNTFSIGGSGQCYVFDKSYSIMGAIWTLSTRQFCDAYYYPYFLPILTWFFYCCTGLYIWFSLRDAFARRV